MTTVTFTVLCKDKKLRLEHANPGDWYTISDVGHDSNNHIGVVTSAQDFVTTHGRVYSTDNLILTEIKSIRIEAEQY